MSAANPQFDIEKIALLARIKLSPDQVTPVQEQVAKVLRFVNQFSELDLAEIEPFFGAAATNAMRQDAISEGLSREQALKNAPDHDGEFFRVPPVFNK